MLQDHQRERTSQPDPSARSHAGEHRITFSFEVFWYDDKCEDYPLGWYWWACFPGCLPDGEATGPFRTSYLAWVDATGDAG